MSGNMNDTERLDHSVQTAFEELQSQYGKTKNDYYGLVFFEQVLRVERPSALSQVTFGNHDLGIDGFYFDPDQETLRLFQFKNSKSVGLFSESYDRLIEHGLPALFGDLVAVPDHQPIIDAARRAISDNRESIAQIFIDFVFRGDPQDAERSAAIKDLNGRLEEKSWLLQKYFGDRIPLLARFLPFDSISLTQPAREDFTIRLHNYTEVPGPNGVQMYLGFVPLIDLYAIYTAIGRRFLERNIRFALPADGHVNRSLARTFTAMLLDRTKEPEHFALNHNGVTMSAGTLEPKTGSAVIFAPRLLNGAQTITTFADFWERNEGLRATGAEQYAQRLLVPCRIIARATAEMITDITISNNRQNPVLPWQLHSNDQIQLQLEDWFRTHLQIPYQRQDRAFSKVSAEDWQAMEYKETKAINLMKLARTYLAVEGELTKLSHIREVFENDDDYKKLFGPHRLNADPQAVLLCYKVQFRVGALAKEIADRGASKYGFVNRTREIIFGLVCQAMLNDENGFAKMADEFGQDLSVQHDFTERLRVLASTRVRPLLKYLLEDKQYKNKVEEGNYSFMRTTGAFEKAMRRAKETHGWKLQKL